MTTQLMHLLVYTLAEGPDGHPRRNRRRIALAAVCVILLLGGAVLTLWVLLRAGQYGWRTGDWERLDVALTLITPLIIIVAFPIALWTTTSRRQRQRQRLRDIRDVIATDRAAFAPYALMPTPPFGFEAGFPSTDTFVQFPLAEYRSPLLSIGAAVIAGLPLWLLLILNRIPQSIGQESSGYYDMSTVLLVCNCFNLLFIIVYFGAVGFLQRRKLIITTDAEGLSWRLGTRGEPRRMLWSGVQGFYVAQYERSSVWGRQSTVAHILDTDDVSIGWLVPQSAPPDRQFDMWRLAHTIATRTGAPPRDLAVVHDIVEGKLRATSQPVAGIPEALFASIERAHKYLARRTWVAITVGVALALSIGAIEFKTVDIVQSFQRGYFAGLPPKIHAETPIFSDALTLPDNSWQVARAVKADKSLRYGVSDGAYQLTGESNVTALAPGAYENIAVEVTVRQNGLVPRTTGPDDRPYEPVDGAGLAFWANGNEEMVFTVSPTDGSWELGETSDYGTGSVSVFSNDYGVSSAVHTGDGASNDLLVLVRGQVILMYVNGSLVGTYTRLFRDPNHVSGDQVGLFLVDGATTGQYTNFAVYQVKPPSSLRYV